MAQTDLKLVVGADVNDAVAGIAQLQKGLADTSKQAETAGAVTSAAISSIVPAAQEANVTIGVLRATLKDLKAQLETATGGANIESLNIQIKGFSDAIKEATTVSSPAKASFEKLRVGFEDIERISNGASFGIRGMAQNFYLLGPALTIALAAVGFLIEKFLKFKDATETTSKVLAEANKEFSKAATQVYTLTENVKLAKEGFIDKNTVIKEYNDSIGETIGHVTTLDQVEQNIAKNGQAYIKFTLLKAAANIAYGKAADSAFQAALIEQKQIDAFKNPIADSRVSQQGTFNAADYDAETKRIAIAQKARKDAAIKAENEKNQKLLDIGNDFEKQASDLAHKAHLNFEPVKPKKDTADKSQNETLRFLEETKKNLEEIQKFDLSPVFKKFNESADGEFGNLNADIVKQKIAKAISDGAKDGVSQANIKGLVDSLKGLGDKQANPNLSVPITVRPVVDTEDVPKAIEKQFKTIKKSDFPKLSITVDPNPALIATQELADKISDILNKGISESLIGVSQAIGAALGSGANLLSAGANAIVSILGGLIEQIGEALITYGSTKEAAIVAGQSLDPFLAIAAGVAAVVAGSALKSKVQATPFADGGIVLGPTLSITGEAGPEAILPLSKLHDYFPNNNNSQPEFSISHRISGPDLLVVINRANKNKAFVN